MKSAESKIMNFSIIDHVGSKGGLDLYNDNLADGLEENGVKVKVYSNYTSKYSKKYFADNFIKSIYSLLNLFYQYWRVLKQVNSEVVILHLFNPGILDWWIANLLAKKNCQIVYILHDGESLISKSSCAGIFRKLTRVAKLILVHNQFTYDFVKNKMDDVSSKLRIISHVSFENVIVGISTLDARKKLSLPFDRKLVLFFGMIKQSKGLDVLIDAMKDVEADLVIAGRMRKHGFESYQKQIDNLGLNDSVHLDLDYISNENRNAYFQAADIIILPYKKIFQSGVLILALKYELPVVASDITAFKEFTKDFKCLMLFEKDNSDELNKVIVNILANSEIQNQLIEEGRLKLAKDHNPKLIAATILNYLSK